MMEIKKGANPDHCGSIRKQLDYMGKQHTTDINEYKDETLISFADQWICNATISVETIDLLKKSGRVA